MNVRFAVTSGVLTLLALMPMRAAETAEQWIVKARGYLGSEAALDSVTTIHFTGTLEAVGQEPSPTGKSQPERLPIEIVFQKPYQQQMTVTGPSSIDTTVLDDYDGWSKSTAKEDSKKWRMTLLGAEQIKQLRANTWENLNFYAGLSKKGGSVQLGEEVTVDGINCAKLLFIHSDRIVFRRYFDKATGRLVKTETSNGSEIREEGELSVNGIRFPKKIINKSASGQATTIVFDKVVLNETVPASEFAVPSLRSE